ncbi:MAG: AAA family ATPase, partial [Mucilaginibacter sp.]
MLQKLVINNYALIDNLEISFSDGLNILTGETGAGKSIILGALSLILGQRAESRYF